MSAILRGVGLNLLSRVSVIIGGGGALVLLARTFGPHDFGSWSKAVVWASLVGTLSEGGVANTLLHRAARSPEHISSHIGALLKARLGFGVLAFAAALVLWLWIEGPMWVGLLVLLGGSRILDGLGASLSFALYTVDEFKTPALLEIVRRFGFLLALLVISQSGGSLMVPALVQLSLALLAFIVLLRTVRGRLGIDLRGRLALGQRTLWFWLTGLFAWMNAELDLMMLGILTTATVTGTYAAAIRLVIMLSIVSSAVSHAVIARFFRSGANQGEPEHTDRLLDVTALAVTGLGAVMGVEFIFDGTNIARLLYGPGYAEAGRILSLLGIFVIVEFARQAPSWYVAASGGERTTAVLMGSAALLNLGGNLILIPRMA
ncbi:MAG: oligosaccharide flippase family protein, partial [Myxococcota bacterium]